MVTEEGVAAGGVRKFKPRWCQPTHVRGLVVTQGRVPTVGAGERSWIKQLACGLSWKQFPDSSRNICWPLSDQPIWPFFFFPSFLWVDESQSHFLLIRHDPQFDRLSTNHWWNQMPHACFLLLFCFRSFMSVLPTLSANMSPLKRTIPLFSL